MLLPPKVVRARSPDAAIKTQMRLLLSEETWNTAIEEGNVEKIGEYMGLVQTGMPHLDGAWGLLRAHALWQGLRRPLGAEVSAPNHYAYIICSNRTFTYSPGDGNGSLLTQNAPTGCVFMVTVELPEAGDSRLLEWSEIAGVDVSGMVHEWDWVSADEDNPDQPWRPGKRFEFRHW